MRCGKRSAVAIALLGLAVITGCATNESQETAESKVKVIEHTTTTPPPGIIDRQKALQEAQMGTHGTGNPPTAKEAARSK